MKILIQTIIKRKEWKIRKAKVIKRSNVILFLGQLKVKLLEHVS